MVEPGATSPASERCTWCGADVEPDDGFRLAEEPGDRGATFCRLEHLVPWALSGAHWEAGEPDEPPEVVHTPTTCSHCGGPLGDVRLVLVRHRGEHRIPDAFCSVDHAREWAKAGGRWR